MSEDRSICIDEACRFATSELFFSTTDRRGVIRSGNDVFTRISGYKESELIGFAHSKVRHPAMPHSVFQLFWNTIEAGDTIAAYVKNRAKDGRYYWVMAVAAPIENGFLSVRLKPTSPLLSTVEKVYAKVRDIELSGRDRGLSKEKFIAEGTAVLFKELSELGFADYPAFMHHALSTEMVSRQKELGRGQGDNRSRSSKKADFANDTVLRRLLAQNETCDQHLNRMLSRLSEMHLAIEAFPGISAAMVEQSRLIGMAALNSRISATSDTLKAVSQAMAETEVENRELLDHLQSLVETLVASLDELSFEVSVAALQGEVCTHFLDEVVSAQSQATQNSKPTEEGTCNTLDSIATLIKASSARIESLFARLENAGGWFRSLESRSEQLACIDRRLQFVRLVGVTESATLASDHTFRDLFNELQGLLEGMRHSCDALAQQVKASKSVTIALTQDKFRVADQFRLVTAAFDEFRREREDATASAA